MRMSVSHSEKRALQIAVGVGSIVPISVGAAGLLLGPAMLGDETLDNAGLDGHFRYLSGLLLGVGLGYAAAIPHIERRRRRFLLLAMMVMLGGIGRLASALLRGSFPAATIAALIMELLVTPGLTLWQLRIARKS